MKPQSIARALADAIAARDNCTRSDNTLWLQRWGDRIAQIMQTAPSGSGIDAGTKLLPASAPDCLKLQADFHHMDEHGSYDGWTEHTITVRPSFLYGLSLTISGRKRNDIKDYLHDVYYYWLSTDAPALPDYSNGD